MNECNHQLDKIPILKGKNEIGNNHFCIKPNCHYERDGARTIVYKRRKNYGE